MDETTDLQRPLVVGIGTGGADAALGFAVEQARCTGRALELVHVLEMPAWEAYAGVYGGAMGVARKAAEEVLDRARERAEALAAGEVAMTTRLVESGLVVEGLVRAAASADLLVLQHRELGRLSRVLGGSVVHGVVGRAPSPVVSVPDGWVPLRGRPPVVTAAVQDAEEAPPLLRAALLAARARRAALVVLHAWWLASGYDTVVVDEEFRTQWADRGRRELEAVLAPLREVFPDVEVAVEVRHAPPVEAVLDAAAVSELVVLGRRHHRLPLGSHLGPVARAAVGHATCPVLFAPEPVTGGTA